MKKHVLVDVLLVLLVLVIAGGAITAFVLLKKKAEPKPRLDVAIGLTAPKIQARVNYRVPLAGTGSARPKVQLALSPQVAGRIIDKAPNFLSGKYVRAGQMLLKIEQTDYVQALDAAKAKVAQLDAQMARLKQEATNLDELEKIERDRLTIAQATYDKARQLLGRGAGAQQEVDNAMEVVLARRQQLQNIANEKSLLPSVKLCPWTARTLVPGTRWSMKPLTLNVSGELGLLLPAAAS